MTTTDTSAMTTAQAIATAARPRELVYREFSWNRLRRSVAYVGISTITLVVLADVLFYRQVIGWTPAAFVGALGLAIVVRRPEVLRHRSAIIICIALAGLCLALIDHSDPLRIAMAMLATMSLAAIAARGWTNRVSHWLARWGEVAARAVFQLPVDVVNAQRWRGRHGARRSTGARALRHWIVPALLSAVFIILFAMANPIIANWIDATRVAVSSFFTDIGAYIAFGRIMLWLAFGWGVWALLRGRTRMLETPATPDFRPASEGLISTPLLVRCLILFNAVFAVQMTLDLLTVLSQGATLPDGMTYSEYARRGAYPLVATALLAAAFVLVTFPSTQATAPPPVQWARRLVYLWIGQNIVLTLSAVWRLHMYVEAFGLTRLRLAAAIWMLLVALGLVFIIWRLANHRSNEWLMRVNAVTALIVLYACCFINFDGFISSYRKEHCMELQGTGPRVDLRYLSSLGIEAIPTLEWYHAQLEPGHPVGEHAGELASDLRSGLNSDLQTWQGWTWRRARLAQTH